MIEGEFHAVWVSPDGGFLDVTPKADGERQILFIPDPDRVYQRRHVENVRLALIDGPAVHRMHLGVRQGVRQAIIHRRRRPLGGPEKKACGGASELSIRSHRRQPPTLA
jgi:hypothetical protein